MILFFSLILYIGAFLFPPKIQLQVIDAETQLKISDVVIISSINKDKKSYTNKLGDVVLAIDEGDTVVVQSNLYYPLYLIFQKFREFDKFDYKEIKIYLTPARHKIKEVSVSDLLKLSKKLSYFDYLLTREVEDPFGLSSDTLKIDVWEKIEAIKIREKIGKNLYKPNDHFIHFEFK